MSLWDAILQGIIQGLTEFLPVSSSGHLSLYQHFTGQSGEAAGLFSILLHLGTLIAVCIAFWDTIWGMIVEFFRMIGDIFTGKFTFRTTDPHRRMIFMLVVALLPLLVFFFLRDWYTSLASDNDIIVEGVCFLATAGLLYLADHLTPGKKDASNMRARDAVLVGVMQGIAPLPGLSRSGSTISAGIFAGLGREFAVAFSFILGIPAVLGANIFEVKDALETGTQMDLLPMLVGMAVAAVVGFLAIKLVRWLARSGNFKVFTWYTAILGVATVTVGIIEKFVQ
jgi:undecaprenyl-diphosphatase